MRFTKYAGAVVPFYI